MEIRYKQLAEVGVKNIDGFNELAGIQTMPYIVIFIDELATLMAFAPVDAEDTILQSCPDVSGQLEFIWFWPHNGRALMLLRDLSKQIFHLALRLMCHP